MSKKLGFWSVFAIVTGSQIGSGVFMLPASLAPYGKYSVLGWLLSGLGAICLALVFSGLCQRFPRTGGPHAYAKAMFGNTAAFFTGWTYWVISWVSTAAVVIACISYLSPFIGQQSPYVYCTLEILLLFAISALNLKGIHTVGKAELFLSILKLIPLLILPCIAIFHFNPAFLNVSPHLQTQSLSSNLSQVVLLTLWGFIGLETATTPAGSVHEPAKTIPRAIILGTLCTALLYLLNSIGIMGIMPSAELAQSKAPYADACQYLFGGHWHLFIAMIASLICIGTLNAWMLTSGQIVLGLAEDQLMPPSFAQKNRNQAPRLAIITSCLGIVPLLYLTANANIANQITAIIDFSVIAFLFVYLCAVFAFIKKLYQENASILHWLYSIIALIFCLWTISQTSWNTIAISLMFSLSGIPVYYFWYLRQDLKLAIPEK